MTWFAILAAAAACFGIKLVGHHVPTHLLERPRPARISALLTVALLAALVGVQSATAQGSVVVDARLAGLGVAALALWLRAPFILVVALAALTAAGIRALGG